MSNYCKHHKVEITGYQLVVDFAIIDNVRHTILRQYVVSCGCTIDADDDHSEHVIVNEKMHSSFGDGNGLAIGFVDADD